MLNFMNTFGPAVGPGWQQLLHAAYVLSGLLMAAGYVGQIRLAWRTPQASLLAQSMPSWLLWTLCRAVALAYVIGVVGDGALIIAVGLDVAGRAGVLLVLLRARLLMAGAARVANPQHPPGRLPRSIKALHGIGRRALICTLMLPVLAMPAAGTAQTTAHTALRELGSPAQQAAYARAMQSLQDKRYADAFGRLAELADQGHAASAQLALVLYDHGPALLGQAWSAKPGQQRRWFALAQPLKRARNFLPDTEARD